MTKSIWAGIIALIIVVSCGIVEVILIGKDYERLEEQCNELVQMCKDQTVTVEKYNEVRDKWVELRETSELLLPHMDVYEINLRFAEGQAYAEQGDYKQLEAQLTVVTELLQYVPHLMTPSFKHIL